MKNIFALLAFAFSIYTATAQNPGYFNHKNVLEATFTAQSPIFPNLKMMGSGTTSNFNKYENGAFVNKADRFDYGLRLIYMRTLKRDLGLGLEFGYDYYSVQRNERYVETDSKSYNFEKTDVSSMMIMPKIEFSNKGSVLPMGVAHQIGIGVRLVKPIDQLTHLSQGNGYNSGQLYKEVQSGDYYTGTTIRGMTFMYAINMRTPLSKRLFLNYGLRYTLNFMSKSLEYKGYDQNTVVMTESEFRYLVRDRRQYSLIQAHIGISFAF